MEIEGWGLEERKDARDIGDGGGEGAEEKMATHTSK